MPQNKNDSTLIFIGSGQHSYTLLIQYTILQYTILTISITASTLAWIQNHSLKQIVLFSPMTLAIVNIIQYFKCALLL